METKKAFTVTVINGEKDNDTIRAVQGENLLALLSRRGYQIAAPCGGLGKCNKCKVKILQGECGQDKDGMVKACSVKVTGDLALCVPASSGTGLTSAAALRTVEADPAEGAGVALDIGTTTLAAYLVDLKTGRQLASASCLNPQLAFGADVISRIKACSEGALESMHRLIIEKTNELIVGLCKGPCERLSVCGNTTMLHLFAGEDATPLGRVPFSPKFLHALRFSGDRLGLKAAQVYVLPGISAYVGADITAGILATDLLQQENAVLMDVGTNGEMAVRCGDKLLCCSTAAGPALEGANISCGSGAVAGAINKVEKQGGSIKLSTISGAPKSICGCGLIDAVALMVKEGIVDETGAMDYSYRGELKGLLSEKGFMLCEGVTITSADVREIQLAKSAMCSGLKTLLSEAGLKADNVKKVYVAGGLGFYIDKEKACDIGLIPRELKDKIEVVGNSGGRGAVLALLSERLRTEADGIAQGFKTVELSTSALFMEEYMSNMFFF